MIGMNEAVPVIDGGGTDLTIPSSGTTYTATEDGWLSLSKRTNSTNYQYIQIGGMPLYDIKGSAWANNAEVCVLCPIKAGQTATINYTAGGAWTYKKFIHSMGTQNTKTIIKY